MVEIEFNYNQMITIIQAKLDDSFQDAINKFMQKSLLQPGLVNFLVNGKVINPSESIESHMNNLNKQGEKMKIIVTVTVNDDQNKEHAIIKSKDIICPQCKEPCRITTENYKIKLYDCINFHNNEDIKFIDFDDTQNINESEIKCDICKFKNKGNCPADEFYRCLNCYLNLCLLCKPNHDPRHNIIKYDQRNYICQIHNEPLIKYCIQCKENICFACEEHEKHEVEYFGNLTPNIEEKKKILSEFKININKIFKTIKEVIDKLNGFMLYINKFYEINNNILKNYDVKKRNFQVLKNLDEINNNNEIIKIIKNISNNNIENKISDILDLYNKMNKDNINNMNNDNMINENMNKGKMKMMTIIYNINNENKIKLFGFDFVKNNKNNCYLIINNIKQELTNYIEIKTKEQKLLEIKLFEINSITNMSDMFNECNSLNSLPDISKWDTQNVTNMSSMFRWCSSLSSLPDISKWDTKNVTDMSCMFHYCRSLNSLPDISEWDTKNVTRMSCMFYRCISLNSLPDISKWNTKNVTSMYYMFGECRSLNSLPDISEWDTKNVTDMSYMFYECSSLNSLPDISKWDTKNVTSMYCMFNRCSSLNSLPDISKWDTKNVTIMSSMFNGCSSLNSFPDISKWKLNKNLKTENMFDGVDKKIIPKKFKGCLIY